MRVRLQGYQILEGIGRDTPYEMQAQNAEDFESLYTMFMHRNVFPQIIGRGRR